MKERFINKTASAAHLSEYFTNALDHLTSLMQLPDLDQTVSSQPSITCDLDEAVTIAIHLTYGAPEANNQSHLFLQRVLYRINRLKFFWYDDLTHYNNERSDYLRSIRDRIESAWQSWELTQFPTGTNDQGDVAEALRRRAADDVAPRPSAEGIYFRDYVGVAGYRRLLEIASLDGLVEASQLSRTLGGVSNDIHAMMTRLLVEEYGGGRLSRKHSSFFTHMLDELGIDATPEAHFDLVPWQVLAPINHSFLLSERKRFYLRYVGGLLFTEISVPAAFDNYRLAAERLGMSEKARGYWDLHIKEDERHGRWMLHDIALPLAKMYPANAHEIVLGYDQQKFMGDRAGKATVDAVKQVDYVDRIEPVRHARGFEVAA